MTGAHQDVLVARAAGGPCERIEAVGTWLAVLPEIGHASPERTIALARGDLMALYTDGITEATNAEGEMFGLDRLAQAIEQARDRPIDEVCAHVFQAVRSFTPRHEDDMTLVVARYHGT
jgi:sigma-B regulation protein RsbU (phosphoserine phosphatase)